MNKNGNISISMLLCLFPLWIFYMKTIKTTWPYISWLLFFFCCTYFCSCSWWMLLKKIQCTTYSHAMKPSDHNKLDASKRARVSFTFIVTIRDHGLIHSLGWHVRSIWMQWKSFFFSFIFSRARIKHAKFHITVFFMQCYSNCLSPLKISQHRRCIFLSILLQFFFYCS